VPCATVHLLLAGKILADWEEGRVPSPISIERPEIRDAFLHGAMAPDMGFMPGVDRFFSELAHYLAPADLARALLDASRDPEGDAFAWGWATHVLGDVAIHPIIGRGVGEWMYGDRTRRVDARENVAEHVSLEVGLDIWILLGRSGIPGPPQASRFDSERARQIESALLTVYGIRWDRSQLLQMNRQAVRLTRWWPQTLRILARRGADWEGGSGRRRGDLIAGSILGGAQALSSAGSAARGFLGPRLPPRWVRDEVDSAIEALPKRFHELVSGRLAGLENRNLETGEEAGAGRGHPASDLTAGRLDNLRSGRARLPALS
jgi:hypothetical protein